MEFSRQGHDVTVITRFRNHDYKNFLSESPICLRMWSKYRLKEVPNIGGRWTRLLARIINRVLKVLFEYPTIEDMFKLKKILKHENGYNLLISFAVPYPVHWGVAWSRTRKHKIAGKWIADCGDPYMGDILDTFRKPFYFKYIEMWFSRKADFLTIPIEGAIDGYYPEFHRKSGSYHRDLILISKREQRNYPRTKYQHLPMPEDSSQVLGIRDHF